MNPIYEGSSGGGIGYNIREFSTRFDIICQQHLAAKRARAFAFIFHDLVDDSLRTILDDQGVFTKLDRLSGNELSIFYLKGATPKRVKAFNKEFLKTLGVAAKTTLPCVVFFKLTEDKVEDIKVVHLDQADLIHGFHELHEIIEEYIQGKAGFTAKGQRAVVWLKTGTKFIALEAFRTALKRVLEIVSQ
jgi:hypothetical protein